MPIDIFFVNYQGRFLGSYPLSDVTIEMVMQLKKTYPSLFATENVLIKPKTPILTFSVSDGTLKLIDEVIEYGNDENFIEWIDMLLEPIAIALQNDWIAYIG